ncbi:aldehyde dehydrogenase family protein, partial [Streptomyces sp. NPDC055134]
MAGAVWTQDVARAHHVARCVKAGTFWINSYKTIHVAVPFGGFGDSGHGRSSGPGVLDEYTQTKAVWTPTRAAGAPFPSLRYRDSFAVHRASARWCGESGDRDAERRGVPPCGAG